jgi:hypothetical protein
MDGACKIQCEKLNTYRPIYLSAILFIIFVMMYYVYRGIEHSIRQKILHELNMTETKIPGRPCVTNEQTPEASVERKKAIIYEEKSGVEAEHEEEVEEGNDNNEIIPSAPPLNLIPNHATSHDSNWCAQNMPPPPYDVVTNNGEYTDKFTNSRNDQYRTFGLNDLEWHKVFDAFNEKRMEMALKWTPPPVEGRPLKRCIEGIDAFLKSGLHPVNEQNIYRFLKSFVALTNLVYAEMSVAKRLHMSSRVSGDDGDNDAIRIEYHKELFLKSFHILMNEYMPKTQINNRIVPFGYDWFIFSGRMTYAVLNAHVTLCSVVDKTPSVRPYYSEHLYIGTNPVVRGLKNICKNFTESLGYERYSSNCVYIGTAFLYASLLEKACARIKAAKEVAVIDPVNGLLPDYQETLDEILTDNSNRYDTFKTVIDEIGRSTLPPAEVKVPQNEVKDNKLLPAGAQRGDMTYDGVYNDRTFFAHRRLRMYAYVHSYCEQLPSVQLLVREKQLLNDEKLAALLRAIEPMSDEDALFYFNLHSRAGGFKFRNGSAMFAAFGLSKFRVNSTGTSYGRIYLADRGRILFVQSSAFTFHSIGQLTDLAYGEVEKSNRDLMPAWLMGQRPLFHAEKNKLVDIPCSSHLEPCVIDTGKSKDLELNPIKRRNTTDYTPTEASCALVAFEENNIGVVFTSVCEINMDVCYSRCTVATPFYTFTTYFRITRYNNDINKDDKHIRLSCYTGCSEQNTELNHETDGRYEFKHCSVHLYIKTVDGKDYKGTCVEVEKQIGVEKRGKSKSKYTKDELENVSLLVRPFGHMSNTALPGSITILYRPKNCKPFPLPKSFETHKISPRVTVMEPERYRVQVDSRYVIFCDTRQNLVILLDIVEKRACIAPICSKIQDDRNELDSADLLEKTLIIIKLEISGTLILESITNNRVYAFVADE